MRLFALGSISGVALTLGLFAATRGALRSGSNDTSNARATERLRGDIVRLIVGEGARLAAAGVALGIAASLGITRLLASLLYGVSVTDPVTFAGVAALRCE